MRRLLLLFLSGVLLFAFSCVRDVDVDQTMGAAFQFPTSIALLKLDLTQHDFFDDSNLVDPDYKELFLINLDGIFYESNTDSLILETQFINTFDRDFSYVFEFLDSHLDHVMRPTEPQLVPVSDSPVIHSITFEGEDFENLSDARRINVKISLNNPNDMLDPNDDRILQMQSVIHYMFELVTPSPND